MHTYTPRSIKSFKISHRHFFLGWKTELESQTSILHFAHSHAGVQYGSLTLDKSKVVAGRDRCGCVAMLKFQVSRIPISIRPFFFARATTATSGMAFPQCNSLEGWEAQSWSIPREGMTLSCRLRQRIQHGSVRVNLSENQSSNEKCLAISKTVRVRYEGMPKGHIWCPLGKKLGGEANGWHRSTQPSTYRQA